MPSLQTKILLFFLCLLASSVVFSIYAFAESAIQCHCFKERGYNPDKPFVSDGYILATSFNSLLAKFFSVPKRKIIMVKMSEGFSQSDLLLALKISQATKVDLRKFLAMRKENKTWGAISSGLAPETLEKEPLLQNLTAGMVPDDAANMVADLAVADFYRVSPDEIKELRSNGLTEKEITLILLLSNIADKEPGFFVEANKKQGRSWSEIAHNQGVEPAEAGKLILAYPSRTVDE